MCFFSLIFFLVLFHGSYPFFVNPLQKYSGIAKTMFAMPHFNKKS